MIVEQAVRRSPIGRRVLASVVAILAAAGLLVAPEAHAVRSRPDLIVTEGRFSFRGGHRWTTRDASVVVVWRHKTANVGAGPSRRSRTAIEYPLATWEEWDSIPVSALQPGGTLEERRSFDWTFGGADYGTKEARICADLTNVVRELRESNNCKAAGRFYVVPYALNGDVGGVVTFHPQPDITVTLRWTGTVGFDIGLGAPSGDDGIFEYRYYTGTLTFTYDYVAGGCTGTGTGTYTPRPEDAVTLTFGQQPRYTALIPIDPDFHFTVTVTCPGVPPAPAPFYPGLVAAGSWMNTGPNPRRFPDPGLERIRGTYTLTPPFPVQYNWNLEASG